jgi:hypothetical protein
MVTKGKPPAKGAKPSAENKPAPKDKRLKWTQTPHVEAGLLRIQKLGIYGRDLTEIMNHIVGEEMRRLLKSGLLTRTELAEAVNDLPKGGGGMRLFRADKAASLSGLSEPQGDE